MASRTLTIAERQYNKVLRFCGLSAYKAFEFDRAKKLYKQQVGQECVDEAYFNFLSHQSKFTDNDKIYDYEIDDINSWRKCTNKFFGMDFNRFPNGDILLNLLASHEYCIDSTYRDKWEEFVAYYIESERSIQYIQKHLLLTWKKYSKSQKRAKIQKLRQKLPFGFDKYDYLQTYGLNQQQTALQNKLDELKLPNLCIDNIYELSYLRIISDTISKSSDEIIKKLQKSFITYFLEYQKKYKSLPSL